jgi:hypothetical protein
MTIIETARNKLTPIRENIINERNETKNLYPLDLCASGQQRPLSPGVVEPNGLIMQSSAGWTACGTLTDQRCFEA